MKIRTVIVDDEFLARKRLESLFREHRDIQLVGEAKNVEEAIQLITTKSPDLIFLDIQMPDGSGFDVLNSLEKNSYKHVVFATAFDTYAIKAFDASAIDYLLKPFDDERLGEALNKVRKLIQLDKKSAVSDKLQALMASLNETEAQEEGFLIKEEGYESHIPISEILYLEASGNYVSIYTEDSNYLHRSTMSLVEKRLSEHSFLRIHRSFLVNTRFIRQCKYLGNNEYRIVLKESTSLISSRSYKESIVDYLKENI